MTRARGQGHSASQGLPVARPAVAGTLSAQTYLSGCLGDMKAEMESDSRSS